MKTFEVSIVLDAKHEHLTYNMNRNGGNTGHGLSQVVLLVRIRTLAVRGRGDAAAAALGVCKKRPSTSSFFSDGMP